MDIYLARPGAKKLGPYSVARINQELAERKFNDTDYWAWYEGLAEWVPLYSVPGVVPPSASPDTEAAVKPVPPVPEAAPPIPLAAPAVVEPAVESPPPAAEIPPAAPTSEPAEPAPEEMELASGMPFSALEQVFLLTNGDGREAMHSELTSRIVAEAVGADFATVRQEVPRDVIGQCPVVEAIRRDKSVPDTAWRAMAGLKPSLVQLAREGAYKICIRTFPVNERQVAALFLFYSKAKMSAA